jgi:hypothetical protein
VLAANVSEAGYPPGVSTADIPSVGVVMGAATVGGTISVGVSIGIVGETIGVYGVFVGVGVFVGEVFGVGVFVAVGGSVGVLVKVGGTGGVVGAPVGSKVGVGVRVGVGDGPGVGVEVAVSVGPPGVTVENGVRVRVGVAGSTEPGVAVDAGPPGGLGAAGPVGGTPSVVTGSGVAVGAAKVAATRVCTSSGESVSPASATTSVDRAAIVPDRAVS